MEYMYKGYTGVCMFDTKAGLFHGYVDMREDVITFQAVNVNDVRSAFEDSVDDYLDFCKDRDETPEVPE